nr:MAG TPA: hypothetical protein [Caudoviricetes sp.]
MHNFLVVFKIFLAQLKKQRNTSYYLVFFAF